MATVTVWVAVLPAAPSESVACTDTSSWPGRPGRCSRSCRSCWCLSASGTCVPLAPQLDRDRLDRVLTRIADRVAVGVRRALVDAEVVARP